jgi:hypothetical protein
LSGWKRSLLRAGYATCPRYPSAYRVLLDVSLTRWLRRFPATLATTVFGSLCHCVSSLSRDFWGHRNYIPCGQQVVAQSKSCRSQGIDTCNWSYDSPFYKTAFPSWPAVRVSAHHCNLRACQQGETIAILSHLYALPWDHEQSGRTQPNRGGKELVEIQLMP